MRDSLKKFETIFTMTRLNCTNECSFEVIYRAHGKDLYKFLCRLAGNRQDAEDLVQETFLSVMKKLPYFKGESSVKTWIYAIAVNKFRDGRRCGKVRDRDVLRGNEASASDNPLSTLVKAETRERVRKAFDDLPAHFREAFALVRFEGMSYREAAQTLGTTMDSIRMRVHRAHLMLAAQLRDK